MSSGEEAPVKSLRNAMGEKGQGEAPQHGEERAREKRRGRTGAAGIGDELRRLGFVSGEQIRRRGRTNRRGIRGEMERGVRAL